jgi:hypothetical protein
LDEIARNCRRSGVAAVKHAWPPAKYNIYYGIKLMEKIFSSGTEADGSLIH